MSSQRKQRVLRMADLFCGAGGTSTGAIQAAERFGYKVELTAVNHWKVAVATHTLNHPEARHLCTGVDLVNPRDLFQQGELDVLWASPECTHHSRARGGKPMHDQSRATAWCVVRWAEAVQPRLILVENVPEFEEWGPLAADGRPLKTKRGALFQAWVGALQSCGYRVEWRVLCAADFGAPTTRRRLFVQAVKGRRALRWPARSHASQKELKEGKGGKLKQWVPAREIIDWTIEGRWLDEMPGKPQYGGLPLSPKTLKRILVGFERHGLKGYILPTQTGEGRVRELEKPLQTVTTEARGIGFVAPYVVPNFGERAGQEPRAHSGEEPLPAVTGHGAGSLVQGFIVPIDHTGNGKVITSDIEQPLTTVTTEARHGVVAPFLVSTAHDGVERRMHDLGKPLGTVCGKGGDAALIAPYLVTVANGGDDEHRARSIEEPAPTVTAGGNRLSVAEPFLVELRGTSAKHLASSGKDIDEPLSVVATSGSHHCMIEPHLLPQQSGGAMRPVSEPAPTVATAGAIALVEPVLIQYNGTAIAARLDEPIGTLTTKDRFALLQPQVEIAGSTYRVRFRWRMLQPKELAAGQSFPPGYQFSGNKTENVKQIGNAVPPAVADALLSVHLEEREAA